MTDSALAIGSRSASSLVANVGSLSADAKLRETKRSFGALIDAVNVGAASSREETLATEAVTSDPRLPGDFISSMKSAHPAPDANASQPVGAAANSGMKGKVDRTSKLYEQALELESYFVKIMLTSMRNTVSKSSLSGDNGFAGKMYEDMLYDEYARDLTKNSNLGLADQVYLQLSGKE